MKRILTRVLLLAVVASGILAVLGGGNQASAASNPYYPDVGAEMQTWYLYVKSGEHINWKFNKSSSLDVSSTVKIYGPGYSQQVCYISGTAAVNTSCSNSTPTASSDAVWKITLDNPENTRVGWDIDVYQGTTIKPGRVWTDEYHISQALVGSDLISYAVDVTLYYIRDDGYIYRSINRNFNGIHSQFFADYAGVTNQNPGANPCLSAYRSSYMTWMDNNTQNEATNYNIAPLSCGGRYKVFFESPASDLPANATMYDGSTDWIKPPLATPNISDMKYTWGGTAGSMAGTVRFTPVGYTGNAILKIDANGNGSYSDSGDYSVNIALVNGQPYNNGNGYAFNGKDANGNVIPYSTKVRFQVELNRPGEIHFAIADAEYRSEGISVYRINGSGTNRSLIYWNDTYLVNAKCGNIFDSYANHSSVGVDSSSGVHKWNITGCRNDDNTGPGSGTATGTTWGENNKDKTSSWGDERYIDDWTYDKDAATRSTEYIIGPKLKTVKANVVGYDDKTGDGVAGTTAEGVVRVGHQFQQTLKVTNTSKDLPTYGPIHISDTINDLITIKDVKVENNPDTTCSVTGQVISCTSTTVLERNEANSILITITGVPKLPPAEGIENTAYASGGSDSDCPLDSTACPSNTTIIDSRTPELHIEKTANSDRKSTDNFLVGIPAQYILTVTNQGTIQTLNDFYVWDTIPDVFKIDTSNLAKQGCSYDASSRKITCKRSDVLRPLSEDTNAKWVITVNVTPLRAFNNVKNEAYVGVDDDQTCVDETAASETDRCKSPFINDNERSQLTIKKTSSVKQAKIGDSFTYTVTVTNTGNYQTIHDSFMEDSIPSAFTLDSASVTANNQPCKLTDAGTQHIICQVSKTGESPLMVGASVSFTFKVTATTETDQTVINTAYVWGDDDDCSNLENAKVTAHCRAPAPVKPLFVRWNIKKTSSTPTAHVNQSFAYVIEIRNTGNTATWKDAILSDALPAGLKVNNIKPSNSCTQKGSAAKGITVSCAVAKGFKVGESRLYTITVTPLKEVSTLDNTAKIRGGGDAICVLPGDKAYSSTDKNASKRCDSTVRIKLAKAGSPATPATPTAPATGIAGVIRNIVAIVLVGTMAAGMVWRGSWKARSN